MNNQPGDTSIIKSNILEETLKPTVNRQCFSPCINMPSKTPQADVRDENILNAALGRPLNKWHYDSPKPDIFVLAAAYCFALCKGHVFHDGNKRTAYIVAVVFLELNGELCSPDQLNIIKTMLGVADGTIGENELGQWFRSNTRTR